MSGDTPKEVAQRMARQAFDAGVRAASQPAAERDRQRTQVIGYTSDVVAAHLEAATSATAVPLPTDPPARRRAIEEQIAAVQDAEDYRVTSLSWRHGRSGFDRHRESVNERGMAGALATLRAIRDGVA